MVKSKIAISALLTLSALPALAGAGEPAAAQKKLSFAEPAQTEISITKPSIMWLWAGAGFHNSEASMLRIMSDDFRDQVVLKTFREISPTISRVFAGYHDWTKSSMQSFADYYDLAFRQADTTIYMVPGRMPFLEHPEDDKEISAYVNKVADNLEFIIKSRNLAKVRYYCLTNEMSMGNQWGYFGSHLELFKRYHTRLHFEFEKRGLGIGLAATDDSGFRYMHQVEWAAKNMDQITDIYCWHVYLRNEDYKNDKPLSEQWRTRCVGMARPGDLEMYGALVEAYSKLVAVASWREKRLMVGEYGYTFPQSRAVMSRDGSHEFGSPETAHLGAITRLEMALAALNAGCHSVINWTMIDYPDPFLKEDGDTQAQKDWYDVARFSGHSPCLSIRYNKNGLIRWEGCGQEYLAYPSLYTMGYFAKLFRKGAKVMPSRTNDPTTRVGAVVNPDNSASVVVVNWGKAKTIKAKSEHKFGKPMRAYVYDSANVPQNKFCDLQKHSGLVGQNADGEFEVSVPAKSVVFLTTDYADRTPSKIGGVKIDGGNLVWDASPDKEHRYYRVFKDGKQIASTVATSLKIGGAKASYEVKSVDKYGNCRAD